MYNVKCEQCNNDYVGNRYKDKDTRLRYKAKRAYGRARESR